MALYKFRIIIIIILFITHISQKNGTHSEVILGKDKFLQRLTAKNKDIKMLVATVAE